MVTGGVGSIGSELVRRILNDGAEEVFVADIDEIKLFQLSKTIDDPRLKCFVINVRDTQSLEKTFSQIPELDVIFHAAAYKHVVVCEDNPLEATLTNIIGTQNIVNYAIRKNVKACILISTDKAVNPTSVMGATKMIAEKVFLNAAKNSSKTIFSVVRFGNVANSRGSVIPVFVDSLLNKKQITITDPHVTRFIMRIEDAVGLIVNSVEVAVGGEVSVLKKKSFNWATH